MGDGYRLTDVDLADKYAFMNVLWHENFHKENHKGVNVAIIRGGAEAHLDAYWAQVTHPSWNLSPESHRNDQIQYIIYGIAYATDQTAQKKLFTKFQNQLGIIIKTGVQVLANLFGKKSRGYA